MSRKLWALLSALMLCVAWLGFGLVSSAAHADGSGVRVVVSTQCDPSGTTWSVAWNVENLKNQSGTLSGTGTFLDETYGPAGDRGSTDVYAAGTSVSDATYAFPGNQPATMTWADGTTEQVTFPVAQRPAGCLPPPPPPTRDASASVSVTPATCVSGATLVYGPIQHATFHGTANGTKGPGPYDVFADADSGHAFSGGGLTKEFTGMLAGPLTGKQCAVKDASASVTVSAATCTSAGVATATMSYATLQGTLDETPGTHTATFDAQSGHLFADGSATKSVSYTVPSKLTGNQCGGNPPTKVTPAAPVFTDKCGTSNDTYTIPATTGVEYKVNKVVKPAGTYRASGTITVVAVAQKSYEITGASSWSHAFSDKTCGSSGGGNGNGNGGHHGGKHGGHHGNHGHGQGNGSGSNTNPGSTGGGSMHSGTSNGAPETGVSSEDSSLNAPMGYGLIGVAFLGLGILLWRRPRATTK